MKIDGFVHPVDRMPSSWCTPYALSVYGEEQYDNCPYGNGNGYGDGQLARMQARGSGCRGGGRSEQAGEEAAVG